MILGWEHVSISSVAEVARGGSPRPIKKFITDSPDGVNWIKIGDTKRGGRYIDSTSEKIRREGIKRSRWVEEGDFLLSNSMSFGRPYVLRISGCIHDGWLVLKPDYARVDQGFLYYVLSSPHTFRQFDSLAAGSTVRNLNIDLVSGVTIPLPPLDEQKRIVAVLDQAFAALDRARAHAQENLQDSNLLFKEILHRTIQGAFFRDQTDFSKCSLADALEVIRNGVNCDQKAGGPCKISRIESIATGSFSLDRVGYAELTDLQKKRARLLPGDILFSHINSVPHVGKTAVFDVDDDVYHGINLLLLRPSKGILSGYMSWFLKAVHASKYWEGICKKSVNQASVNQKDIGKVPFFFPSIAKQSEAVQKLDDVSIQVETARQSYIEKLADIANLRQSLLQKAFSGELT